MLILGILLICSFLVLIISNILTRVGVDITRVSVYEWLPNKYKMRQDSKLLKLYIVYPKSLVTKSSFALYISQILLFIAVLILFIIQCATNIFTEQDASLIGIIYISFVTAAYLISFGFDRIAQLYYKYRK